VGGGAREDGLPVERHRRRVPGCTGETQEKEEEDEMKIKHKFALEYYKNAAEGYQVLKKGSQPDINRVLNVFRRQKDFDPARIRIRKIPVMRRRT
jgi:hypothetical protein